MNRDMSRETQTYKWRDDEERVTARMKRKSTRRRRRKRETVILSNSLSVALREQDTKRIWDILQIRSARLTNCKESWNRGTLGQTGRGGRMRATSRTEGPREENNNEVLIV